MALFSFHLSITDWRSGDNFCSLLIGLGLINQCPQAAGSFGVIGHGGRAFDSTSVHAKGFGIIDQLKDGAMFARPLWIIFHLGEHFPGHFSLGLNLGIRQALLVQRTKVTGLLQFTADILNLLGSLSRHLVQRSHYGAGLANAKPLPGNGLLNGLLGLLRGRAFDEAQVVKQGNRIHIDVHGVNGVAAKGVTHPLQQAISTVVGGSVAILGQILGHGIKALAVFAERIGKAYLVAEVGRINPLGLGILNTQAASLGDGGQDVIDCRVNLFATGIRKRGISQLAQLDPVAQAFNARITKPFRLLHVAKLGLLLGNALVRGHTAICLQVAFNPQVGRGDRLDKINGIGLGLGLRGGTKGSSGSLQGARYRGRLEVNGIGIVLAGLALLTDAGKAFAHSPHFWPGAFRDGSRGRGLALRHQVIDTGTGTIQHADAIRRRPRGGIPIRHTDGRIDLLRGNGVGQCAGTLKQATLANTHALTALLALGHLGGQGLAGGGRVGYGLLGLLAGARKKVGVGWGAVDSGRA